MKLTNFLQISLTTILKLSLLINVLNFINNSNLSNLQNKKINSFTSLKLLSESYSYLNKNNNNNKNNQNNQNKQKLQDINEDNSPGNLTIKEGIYTVKSFKIQGTNSNNVKMDKKNKICLIENLEDYYNFCMPFIKIIYDRWMIQTNNITAIKLVLDNIDNYIDDFQNNIENILIPENINITKYNDYYTPVLSLSENDFEEMKKFNFREQSENYFVFVICKEFFCLIFS